MADWRTFGTAGRRCGSEQPAGGNPSRATRGVGGGVEDRDLFGFRTLSRF